MEHVAQNVALALDWEFFSGGGLRVLGGFSRI